MRRDIFLAFDDVIALSASGSTEVYTSPTHNKRLGAHDQVGVQVVIDNVSAPSGTVTFDLWIEHSPDGRLWLQHSDGTQAFPPTETVGNGDISFASLLSNQTYTRMFSDSCLGLNSQAPTGGQGMGPLMTYVRLAMKLGNTSNPAQAHVKAHVVLRSPNP